MLGILLYIAIRVLMGCISCFLGKRLYFPILMLTVFTSVLAAAFSLFDITWKVGLTAAAIGIVAALLAVVFYKLGVFLLGGILGAGIGLLLSSLFFTNVDWLYWAVILVPALAFGLFALKWCDLFIMASTAYEGAVTAVIPLFFLAVHLRELPTFIYADGMFSTMANLSDYLRGTFSEQYAVPLFTVALIMAVFGFSIQYRAEKHP